MADEVKHIQVNGKYRMMIERAATKGIDGFKVEANGDHIEDVRIDVNLLYCNAMELTGPNTAKPPEKPAS